MNTNKNLSLDKDTFIERSMVTELQVEGTFSYRFVPHILDVSQYQIVRPSQFNSACRHRPQLQHLILGACQSLWRLLEYPGNTSSIV